MDSSIYTSIKKETIEDDALYKGLDPASRTDVGPVMGGVGGDGGLSGSSVLRNIFSCPDNMLTKPAANLLTSFANEYQQSQRTLPDKGNTLLTSDSDSSINNGSHKTSTNNAVNEGHLRHLLTQRKAEITSFLSSRLPIISTSVKKESSFDQLDRDCIHNDTGLCNTSHSTSKHKDSVMRAMLTAPPIYGSSIQDINNKCKSGLDFEYQPTARSVQEDAGFTAENYAPSGFASDEVMDSPESLPLLPPKASNPQMTREDFNAFCRAILLNGGPAKINSENSTLSVDVPNDDVLSKIKGGQEKGKRKFQCDICHKSYGHNSSLKVHYRVHTGERPFKCHVCDRDFSHSNSLQIHIKTHSDKPAFKCDHCKMEFSRSNHLSYHMPTNTMDKPFVCGFCGKSFSKACNLKVHMRAHTSDKPSICDSCRKAY
ncbi:sal-like protein 1 [Pecten maximus]|uniref:sal-like protein 1 n=1 Tax=Pecten maximus TaxID=6579 RepID=UPI001458C1A7|nr:sal-like protein 1 [Pecten maximus]